MTSGATRFGFAELDNISDEELEAVQKEFERLPANRRVRFLLRLVLGLYSASHLCVFARAFPVNLRPVLRPRRPLFLPGVRREQERRAG
jgi:hypothetical protein